MKISVTINTFNEEKNIENCLKSVKWADEIIVVDMYSDDKTVEIAKRYTDNIFFFERMGYADPARQFALEKASNEWILVVDADEIVPLQLKNKLDYIMKNNIADVVYIPHNNYFAGRQINGMGWGALQNLHPRFFKKDYVTFEAVVHDFTRIKDDSRKHYIDNPEEGFIHFAFIDFEHNIEKMNKYTTIEAANMFDGKKERIYLLKLFLLMLWRTIKEIILIKWYKDGFRGISIGFLAMDYCLVTYMKLKLMDEYNSKDTREKITNEYQKIIDKIIREYEK